MYKINDQVQAAIYFNDVEFVVTAGNFVQSIHIAAHAVYSVPLLTFSIVDMFDVVAKLGLTDGTKIKVSVSGGDLNYDRTFRVHSWDRSPAGAGYAYTVTCYWDAPKYFIGTTNTGILGSSSAAITKVAATCGLKTHPSNVTTADSMLWAPGNRSYADFVREICKYGYVDPSSYLGVSVDSLGYLRYRNISALADPKYVLALTPSVKGQLQVLDVSPSASPGTSNILTGYHHARVVQSATTKQEVAQLNTLTTKTGVKTALFNQEVQATVKRGGISFSPIDFGNVHPNYERAFYQNTRRSLMNSLTMEFSFGFVTPFECFDTFSYVSPAQQEVSEYDGSYIVTGKVVYVVGTAYYEKITAVRMGLN
jgi:hypothetical protein